MSGVVNRFDPKIQRTCAAPQNHKERKMKMRLKPKIVGALMSLMVLTAGAVAFSQTEAPPAPAPAATGSAKSEPSLEQRIADLEAYVNNGARGADAADSTVTSKVGGAGPGHNAWMMTSSALVLFMTLPGLALFYGGLVRKKNVLSVLAQCLGITGLVTIMWWAVGYSLVFSTGGPIIGGLD